MRNITIDFASFVDGSISDTGLYESTRNVNLGAMSSDYIQLKKDVTYTLTITYNTSNLANFSNPWMWGRIYAFSDIDTGFREIGVYNERPSNKTFEYTIIGSDNIRYIRVCATHIKQNAVTIALVSDEIDSEKVILRLHFNGDLESFVNIVENESIGYRFKYNSITVPKIIEYNESEVMPIWVKDTGNPISFFKEGIVIKGNIINS